MIKKLLEHGSLQWQRWADSLSPLKQADVFEVANNLFREFLEDVKEKAIELQSAEMRSLVIIQLPRNRFAAERTKLIAEYEKKLGISLPRVWRSEEKNLRKQQRDYLKVFLRCDAKGKASLIYAYTFFDRDNKEVEPIVVLKQYDNPEMEYVQLMKRVEEHA